ncbi:Atypical chemokine receptor 3 [Sciurus carolinensis]|uniref:Atypical chemokine receptor 3 n=1 Tax=Sciurus carolinensis TaxID=30640 RepID=A0AA41N6L7_SCICA|nr:Atypical chemokine receptor 3 [Sciurus carolinensis]
MDLNLFNYMEPENLSDFSWPCNSSDSILVDTVQCPIMPHKSILLYVLSFIYIFIFVIGMIANSVVVWVNIHTKTTGYATHCYMLNLAILDLCVVLTIPVWVVSLVQHNQWPMGELNCKLLQPQEDGSRILCVLVWLLAFCVSVPDTYYLKTVTSASTNETYCWSFYPEHSIKEWLISMELVSVDLGFAIPFAIIAIFYLMLTRGLLVSGDQEKHSSQKIIFSYMVVFLVCWLPHHVVVQLDIFSILHYLPFTCQLDNALFTALHATQCLSLVHYCVNPVLYSFINHSYRYKLMKAFVFKYSAKTGLSKVIDTSRVSETECLVLEQNTK